MGGLCNENEHNGQTLNHMGVYGRIWRNTEQFLTLSYLGQQPLGLFSPLKWQTPRVTRTDVQTDTSIDFSFAPCRPPQMPFVRSKAIHPEARALNGQHNNSTAVIVAAPAPPLPANPPKARLFSLSQLRAVCRSKQFPHASLEALYHRHIFPLERQYFLLLPALLALLVCMSFLSDFTMKKIMSAPFTIDLVAFFVTAIAFFLIHRCVHDHYTLVVSSWITEVTTCLYIALRDTATLMDIRRSPSEGMLRACGFVFLQYALLPLSRIRIAILWGVLFTLIHIAAEFGSGTDTQGAVQMVSSPIHTRPSYYSPSCPFSSFPFTFNSFPSVSFPLSRTCIPSLDKQHIRVYVHCTCTSHVLYLYLIYISIITNVRHLISVVRGTFNSFVLVSCSSFALVIKNKAWLRDFDIKIQQLIDANVTGYSNCS